MPNWVRFAYFPLLACTLLIVYAPSLDGPLAFDDFLLQRQPRSQVLPPVLAWHRPETRPLVTLSFAVEQQLFGGTPRVHRIGNLIIHFVGACLLFGLVRRLAQRHDRLTQPDPLTANGIAVAVTTLWALHPLQTESVAYIIQRGESLVGLCYLAFLGCLLRDRDAESQSASKRQTSAPEQPASSAGRLVACMYDRRWQILASCCFLAGIWSKTIMITALAVGPLFDRAFLSSSWRHVAYRRGWLYGLPLAASGLAVVSLLPGLAQGSANVGFGGDAPPASLYLVAQAEVIWRYLFLMIVPNHLSIDHGLRAPATVPEQLPWILATTTLLLTGVAACIRGAWRVGFLVLTPLVILSPTSSLIPTADLMVEHRCYLPLAAVMAGLVLLVRALCYRTGMETERTTRILRVTFCMLAMALAVRTWLRAADYSSGVRLWSQAVRTNPDNDRAFQNLIDAARREQAEETLSRVLVEAVGICESRNLPPIVPLQRLGEYLAKAGKVTEAIPVLQRAIELDEQAGRSPGFRDIHRYRNRAATHVNLALAYAAKSDFPQAYLQLLTAVRHFDQSAEARAMAGEMAVRLGKTDEAKQHFARALELRPGWEQVEGDLLRLGSPTSSR